MATPAEMRTWLRANGYQPGQRGRIHPDHAKAFRLATQAALPEPEKPAEVPAARTPREKKGRSYYPCGWCYAGAEHGRCLTTESDLADLNGSVCKCAANGHKG